MRYGTPLILVLVLGWAPANAAEVTLANDSTVNGVPSTPLVTFLAGESTAAWLTASCTGNLVAARVYWASQLGGAPAQLEQSITFYKAGTHPTPGAILTNQGGGNAVIVAPTLVDGAMNEFRFLDPPNDTVPLSVPVVAGQTLVTSLTFFNQSSGGGPFVPAPTIDQDGCQPLRNAVDVIPGGWNDACSSGATGDFVIRAVVDCQQATVPAVGPWGAGFLATLLAVVGARALRVRPRSGPRA